MPRQRRRPRRRADPLVLDVGQALGGDGVLGVVGEAPPGHGQDLGIADPQHPEVAFVLLVLDEGQDEIEIAAWGEAIEEVRRAVQ